MCIRRIVCVGCLPWQVSHLLTNLNLRFLPTQTPRRPSDDSPSRCVFKLTLPPLLLSQSLFCGYRGVTDLFHRTNSLGLSRVFDLLFDQRGIEFNGWNFDYFFFFFSRIFDSRTKAFSTFSFRFFSYFFFSLIEFFQDCNIVNFRTDQRSRCILKRKNSRIVEKSGRFPGSLISRSLNK